MDFEFYETPETGRSWSIYALVDPRDRRVRYVGWAYNVQRRLADHIYESRRLQTHKARWIRQLAACGLTPLVKELETGFGCWAAAERRWIAQFKAEGADLTNITPGGEGVPGPRGPDALANIRAAAKRRKPVVLTPAQRQRLSEITAARNRARRGLPLSAKACASLSEIHKKRLASLTEDERKARVARALESRSPGWNRGWKHSAESKARIGAANRRARQVKHG